MSLYRQFSSKDDLVLAYLERKDTQFFSYVETSFAKHPGEPAKQLLQYFDDLAVRASDDGLSRLPFRECRGGVSGHIACGEAVCRRQQGAPDGAHHRTRRGGRRR